MSRRLVLRAPAGAGCPLAPTTERVRHAAASGGVAALAGGRDGEVCHGVRYPLLVDFLRDAGRISPAAHDIALRVRELYERTDFRAHETGAYAERTSRTTGESAKEWANEKYRRLERRVLRRAGRDAWTALRAVVIEDRMTQSWKALPAALAEAERWL
ncbi:MAG: hypothetical protein RIC52_00980 [Amphiplicatus sp.]